MTFPEGGPPGGEPGGPPWGVEPERPLGSGPVVPQQSTAYRGPSRSRPRSTPSRFSSQMQRKGGMGAVIVFLLVSAAPIAAAVWWFTRPEDTRQQMLGRIPSGVGTRVTAAGIAFALLVVLAVVVLPGARAAVAYLSRSLHWFRTRPMGLRIVLFPAELVVGLLWFLAQILFAIDAVAIVAAAAAFFLYVLRIIKADWFPWLPG